MRWSALAKGRQGGRLGRRALLAVGVVLVVLITLTRAIELLAARDRQPDALLVLGGSANRERYAAQLCKRISGIKVLISGGSEDPCVWLMFDKAGAPKENVWMEHCSSNTFENFVYSTPVLKRWGARKILVLTDPPQDRKALPMARIMLGAKGIWPELELVPDSQGEPAHHTAVLEVLASLLWAPLSQVVEPGCSSLTHLPDVDMKYWYRHGFDCQQQARVDDYRPELSR